MWNSPPTHLQQCPPTPTQNFTPLIIVIIFIMITKNLLFNLFDNTISQRKYFLWSDAGLVGKLSLTQIIIEHYCYQIIQYIVII